MNPGTGTFISMDTYQGALYEPVTLHKYLYANANPVKYSDPSGMFSLASFFVGNTIGAEMAGYSSMTASIGLSVLSMAKALKVAVYVIEMALALKITMIITEAIKESDCSVIEHITDIAMGVTIDFRWPWQCEKEREDEQSVALEEKKDSKQTYYHVTSKENAIKIIATGVLKNVSGQEGGYVFAWRNMPNRKAVKYSGVQQAEVIIRFKTNAAFEKDPAFSEHGQYIPASVITAGPMRSVFPGPIRISNPIVVANC